MGLETAEPTAGDDTDQRANGRAAAGPSPSRLWPRSLGLAPVAAALLSAALVLVAGLVHGQGVDRRAAPVGALTAAAAPGYAGSAACATCHEAESKAWAGSQHARAMQPATPDTVLGDFADATAEHFGSKAKFFRRDGQYVVETEGRDGKTEAFVIDHTFGLDPLQQYLTTFPDGRVQALPYAWDTRPADKGGQRWFHLYPGEAIPPGDELHWTGAQQNWNFMCADCHSTGVRKGYDAAADRFDTTFAEVSVGCEACHGPAAGHVAWAREGRPASAAHKGFATVAAERPTPDWTPDPLTGSPARGVARPAGDELATCGTCHARRGQFAEGWVPGRPLEDFYRPALLTPDLYEDDGQMREEVFNLATFQQSKMHAKGVICSDCHDPHSGKLKAEGSAICATCHQPAKFATTAHTGHAEGAGQPDCIACHMPKRNYMVVDARHDHSFRIPRPDLSVSLKTPNACNDCHADKPAAWAADAVVRWHGPNRKGAQTHAAAFRAARSDLPEATTLLLGVARDPAAAPIARATALSLLAGRASAAVDAAMTAGLADPDPLVRMAALGGLTRLPPEQRWTRASPLLSDPVRVVRMEAANLLADSRPASADPALAAAFEAASADYVAAERFNADRVESRSNLAGYQLRRGRPAEAEQEYLAALKLGNSVAPRVGLADLYRLAGREADAERLLRETVALAPRAAGPRHALGLALVRAKRYDEAIALLKQAAELEPAQIRYAYVYGVGLDSTGRAAEARAVWEKALRRSPANTELLSALLQDALKARDLRRALGYAERLRIASPDDPSIRSLVAQLKAAIERAPPN